MSEHEAEEKVHKKKKSKSSKEKEAAPATKTAEDLDKGDKSDVTRHQTLEYLKRVEVMIDTKQLDSNPEERRLFINNVLAELQHDEYRICCDLLCSRVLEKLFSVCSSYQVNSFAIRLHDHVINLAANRYGSHVLQAIIARVPASLVAQQDDDTHQEGEPDIGRLSNTFLTMCETLADNISDVINDAYGAHVLAACLLTLAGLPSSHDSRSRASRSYREATHANTKNDASKAAMPVPEIFLVMLRRITDNMAARADLPALASRIQPSVVIQNALSALKLRDVKRCVAMCEQLAGVSGEESVEERTKLPFVQMITSEVGSHVVDKILDAAPLKLFQSLYMTYFRNKMSELALHRTANYTVSSLLTRVTSRYVDDVFDGNVDKLWNLHHLLHSELLGLMLTELVECTEDILAENHCLSDCHSPIVIHSWAINSQCGQAHDRSVRSPWCAAKTRACGQKHMNTAFKAMLMLCSLCLVPST